MRINKRWLILVLALSAAAAAAVTVRYLQSRETDEVALVAVPVTAEMPTVSTVDEVLRYPGTLIPLNQINITPKVAGRAVRVHVSEGDTVLAGDSLVTLEEESIGIRRDQARAAWQAAEASLRQAEKGVREEELDSARASLRQAEEDIASAEKNLERSKRLYEAGTISRASYESAQAELSSAKTTLENARRSLQLMEKGATGEELTMARANAEAQKAQFDLAQLQMGHAEVKAPVGGVVASVLIDEGNLVGMSSPLMAIVQDDPIIARIAVPERFYGRMYGREAQLRVSLFPIAYPDREPFSGRVSFVSPIIDTGSRTFIVEASVDNTARLLKPGMYVNCEIGVDRRENAITVPHGAVVRRDDATVVFVVVTDPLPRVLTRVVVTGLRQDGRIEIVEGIGPEDLVVTGGNAFLEGGQRVRVVDAS